MCSYIAKQRVVVLQGNVWLCEAIPKSGSKTTTNIWNPQAFLQKSEGIGVIIPYLPPP